MLSNVRFRAAREAAMWDSLEVRAVVRRLLSRAEDYSAVGLLTLSRVFHRAAIAADETLHARLAWAEFLLTRHSPEEAIEELTSIWEEAKRRGCRTGVSHSCRLLSVAHERLGQREAASGFRQLALSAAMAAVEAGAEFEQFPELFSPGSAAERHDRKAENAAPNSVQGWIALGLNVQANDPVFALECLRRAWRICGRSFDPLAGIRTLQAFGQVLCRCGKWQAGARMWDRAANLEREILNGGGEFANRPQEDSRLRHLRN